VRGERRWRPLAVFSLAWAVLIAVVVFLPSAPADGYALWSGPGSMVHIALLGIWQVAVSQRLARWRPGAGFGVWRAR
jgi:hypothetical protein